MIIKREGSNVEYLATLNLYPHPSLRARVTFFKESGKYYASEEVTINVANNDFGDTSDTVQDAVDIIKELYKDSYKDMNMVIEFQYNCKGYPFMITAQERK